MPTPPTDLADWATDANYSSGPYTGTPTKVAPSAGEFEQGHGPGQKTAAQKQNTWQYRVGKWVEYLNDLVTSTFELVANNSFKVSGTGKYKRGAKVRTVPLAAGSFRNGGSYQTVIGSAGAWNPVLDANGEEFHIPIELSEDEVLTKVEFEQATAVGSTVSYYLMKQALSGGFYTETAVQTLNATSATAVAVSWSGMTEAIVPAEYTSYYVVAKQTNGGALNSGFLTGLRITTTVP